MDRRFRVDPASARPTCEQERAVSQAASTPSTFRRNDMRFMILVKANADSEAGVMPSTEILTAMGKFNEELVKAGVLLAGEGLHPSSKGVRVRCEGPTRRTVIDGPFAETKELLAGFWLFQCKSKEEAIEWIKRSPFQEGEIEIRQVFEASDFGDSMTPELLAQEERLRAESEARAKAGWPPRGQTDPKGRD